MGENLRPLLMIESAGRGGAESVVFRLAAELQRRGIDVAVATLRTGWLTENLDRLGIKRFQLPSAAKLDLRLPFRIASLLRNERFTVLHSHLLDSNFYGALGARLARVPHLATEHGDVHHTNPKRFLRIKLRIPSLLGSTFAVVSQFTSNGLIELGVDPARCVVVPNPVETLTPSSAERRRELRAHIGVYGESADHWLWLHVANLRAVKDQATLLRAFAKAVRTSSLKQTLCIVGDGEERENLLQLQSQLGLQKEVVFLGFQDNVLEWLTAGDGFVLSSRSEAMPVSLLEAAAAGKVIVSTAVGGIPEVVTAERGYLVPAGDEAGLALAFGKATSNIPTSRQKSNEIQRFVVENFSPKAVVDNYLKLYKQLLGD